MTTHLAVDLARVQRVSCETSGAAGTPGATQTLKLDPGVWELRCDDDVCFKIGVEGQDPTMLDNQMKPGWWPYQFLLRESKTLLIAATGTNGSKVWLTPMVSVDDVRRR